MTTLTNPITAEIKESLEKPFDRSQIKTRKGRGGKFIYIEASAVIQRLNDALGGDWSFQIDEHFIEGQHIVVLGRLQVGNIIKMQFGGKQITFEKDTGEIVDLGDDLKAAASDALKKCATLFGVGLSLYMDETTSGGRTIGDRPQGNAAIGELKNDILALETEIQEGLGILRNTAREEQLGNLTLDHPVDKLRQYYQHLQKIESAND
jgi:hypothetical protein